tara:strand:- start:6906 stop:7589 length:684 start_codon:yes stop_codon:yes gene_type:complete
MFVKVSVLMSCYNSQATISKSVESILSQSYEDIELLICDDGSIDDTYKTIEEYSKADKRISIFKNEKNIGLTKSLNFLINKSDGEFIARQDDDDISLEQRIEKQIKVINDLNLDFVTSRAKILGTDKLIPGISFNLPVSFVMNFKNPFIHGTLLIKKKILNDVGNYDERFYYAQDYKLFSDLVAKGYKYTTIKEPLYRLNVKDNISNNFKKEQDYYSRCVRNNSIPN